MNVGTQFAHQPWRVTGYDRHDVPNFKMCFKLYGDPLQNGVLDPSKLIVSKESDNLLEAEWGTIFAGTNDPKALTSTGHWSYRLLVTADACDGTAAPALGANSMKFRSTGYLFYPNEFSFWPRDSIGEFVPGGVTQSSFGSKYDTAYDGTWVETNVIEVPDTGSQPKTLNLFDSDADRFDDAEFPGLESVANDLSYKMLDYPSLAPIASCANGNPSGNYYKPLADLDIDKFECKVDGTVHPEVDWAWSKILASNMIHVWRTGSVLFMSGGRPFERLPVSSARPVSTWLLDMAAVSGELPFLLGELDPCGNPAGSSIVVDSVWDAVRILEGKSGPGYGGPKEVREFRKQLLAAKLNIAAVSPEPLGSAYLYGSESTVAQLIAAADAALGQYCQGMECTSECQGVPGIPPSQGNNAAALLGITPLLVAVNLAKVIYEPPAVPPIP